MKEAIGGSWLFVFVIVFISLFAGFVSLAVNYSRCYNTKDQIIKIIEKGKGINSTTVKNINQTLTNTSYRGTGKCPNDGKCWYSFDITKDTFQSSYNSTTNYCLSRTSLTQVKVTSSSYKTSGVLGHVDSAYYSVVVFFQLDIPVLFNNFQITIEGETSPIYTTSDYKHIKNNDEEYCVHT